MVGRKPTMPHRAAGMRVDPPVSEPMPAGANRAATPAALPPLLPPGILDGSYGLRTGPNAPLLLVMPNASSCMLALPKRMPPARSRASRTCALARGRLPMRLGVPAVVGSVALLMLSLMSSGNPCRGPARCPRARALSAARAASRTCSGTWGDQHVEILERAGPPQEDGSVGLGPQISGSHCRQGLGGSQLQHLAPCRRGGVCKGPTRTGQAASYEKL